MCVLCAVKSFPVYGTDLQNFLSLTLQKSCKLNAMASFTESIHLMLVLPHYLLPLSTKDQDLSSHSELTIGTNFYWTPSPHFHLFRCWCNNKFSKCTEAFIQIRACLRPPFIAVASQNHIRLSIRLKWDCFFMICDNVWWVIHCKI